MFACAVAFNAGAEQARPLSLQDAMIVALTGSPAIKEGCDIVTGAKYGLDLAEGDLGLRFSTQSGSGLGVDTQTAQSTTMRLSKKFAYGTDVELSAGNTSTDDGFFRSFSGIALSQSVFRGFGPLINTARIVDSSRRIVSSRRQLDLVRQQTLLDVTDGFYRVVEQKMVIGISSRSLEHARALLQASQSKLEKGLATKSDVFRAQTQTAAAESAHLESEEALEDARDGLRVLLGMKLSEPIDVEAEIATQSREDDEEALVEEALERRIDVVEASDQVKDAERELSIAKRDLLPDLRVGVNYSLVGTGSSLGDSARLNDPTVSLILSTDVPLDRDAAKAQYGQAAVALARKKRALEELKQKDTREVRALTRRLATLRRRLALQESESVAARATLDLATLRFDRGYASNIDVLQAEDALAQSQRAEIRLRIEQTVGALKVRAATGSLGSYLDTLLDGRFSASVCP